MNSQPQNLQFSPDQNPEYQTFPHEKVIEIINALRKADSKFSVAGTIRAEIKKLPEDYKIQLLSNLRCASLRAGNEDVALYLAEIIN